MVDDGCGRRRRRARLLVGLVAGLGAVVGCAGAAATPSATAGAASAPSATLAASAATALGAAGAATVGAATVGVGGQGGAPAPLGTASAAAAPAPAAAGKTDRTGQWATFYRALTALKSGTRKKHVRVLWLGDSHAQADFWTDHIRAGLQQQYGHGGPGFIRIGYRAYRHAGVAVKVDGSWRMRPKRPSTITPWGDGAFGLGGILHAGYAGYRRARLRLTDETLANRKVHVELCYKFGLNNDRFEFAVSGRPAMLLKADGPDDVGHIRYASVDAKGLVTMQVVVKAGRPDFCGVTVETDPSEGAGVVLDNIGINGARYATFLAWDEQAWAEAVKHRPPPELFVFEFGGNEASDRVIEPARYERNARALIERARRIREDASCLVVGPSDRSDAEQKIPPIVAAVKAAAAAEGCAFWDTYDKMGGRGSLSRWQLDGRAAKDGVHLKPKGYTVLGTWLLRDMLAGMAK